MSKYSAKLQEEELKLHVAEDWFASYDCKRRIGKIDFCVDIPATKGKEQMNTTSTDEKCTALLADLSKAMASLAKEIEPKVYEYGFLKR